jgi:hypothetical protein
VPRLSASSRRDDTRVRFFSTDGATVVEVSSDFGIDQAVLTRLCVRWPSPLFVRLHLRGLESFKAGNDDLAVEWSVAAENDTACRVTLWKDGQELPISHESPYYTLARCNGVGGDAPPTQPYFEVPLPRALFQANPERIRIQWIDYYRN